ncbi:MAG: Uncharacterized protein CEN89_664 [Candidatus Berkelbacteria bacterium Licking1014_7]|uniref:phenylalanine--tRNA ligase n=1 Tax=Candidatus Berkelbacteria bacterium Licking1014_7 TaxID=2017147 RepID=A0A554LHZ7_9BACT|nr:MAG: Uncharacterized protein CEN89_664 [Candidatus Berkelbacteria bacterium Licking1014_7]
MLLPINQLNQLVKVVHTAPELAEIFVTLGFETENISGDIIDLEVTPNRGDCFSILGLAREYGVKTNQQIHLPKLAKLPQPQQPKTIDITFETSEICPRFSAIILENVKIKPSNQEIKNKLNDFDIEPINNIVDITNLVMLELGMPLHGYDLDKITQRKMRFRWSKKGESITTIDQKTYSLPVKTIICQDGEKIIDLSGIQGAENTQISKNTKNILIQSAIFPAKQIRKTAKLLSKTTQAGLRYEKGVDYLATNIALERALFLIQKETGAKLKEFIDIENFQPTKRIIDFSSAKIKKLIGTDINQKIASKILDKLGIKKTSIGFETPSWRKDLELEPDLIEEVIRIYGYDKLNKSMIETQIATKNLDIQKQWNIIENIKNTLALNGFNEVQNYSFISEKEFQAQRIKPKEIISPDNPISHDNQYLRPNLLTGILKTFSLNRWCWSEGMNIFEIGTVFNPKESIHIAIASYSSKIIQRAIGAPPILIQPEHQLAKYFKIKKPIYFYEIPLEKLHITTENTPIKTNLRPIKNPSFNPPLTRDIAIIIDKNIDANTIQKEIFSTDDKIILVELFDEFINNRFGKDKKSLAFHLVFDDENKTIEKKSADKIFSKIISKLEKKYKAKLR